MTKKYLLDTHTFLWASYRPVNFKLSKHAKDIMEEKESELFISAISLFEILNKYRLGKLTEYKIVVENITDALVGLEAKELPLSWEHARLAGGLDWTHGDPFDRLLAAQTQMEDMTLITCDKAFDSAPGVVTLW
jgi:PIN domain nuclease of toxin-antitoxin system